MGEKELKIQGMTCQHCVNTVKRALSEVEGVSEVEVSLEEGKAKVKLEKEVPFETLKEAVETWGYKVVE
ncbi:heavy-metal-associated domain-containing protein [Aquifex aeolicus]|uniref:heavy-metal-associated domain-containing protein n=1 Tax=Aquifex aeolicus TaxID=63363 RepID=UPI0000168489|nr:heavy-metal-associated domain-containing protein [Aquifex aeolicus]